MSLGEFRDVVDVHAIDYVHAVLRADNDGAVRIGDDGVVPVCSTVFEVANTWSMAVVKKQKSRETIEIPWRVIW